MSNPKVYAMGRIGTLTYEEATGWRDVLSAQLEPEIKVLDPMRGKESLAALGRLNNTGYPGHIFAEREKILQRDLYDVRSCDAMVAYLNGTAPAGRSSMVELGAAWALNKPIIGLTDPMNPGDWQRHVFVSEIVRVWFTDMNAMCLYLRSLLLG